MRNAGLLHENVPPGHTYRVMVKQYNASLSCPDPLESGTLILDEEQSMTPETLSRGPLNPARILVIKLRHHGDMLLITPLIHALKQQYPAASVDVLLYEETRDMLAANPDIHHIYGLDRRWKKQGKRYQLKMQWQLIQTLRQQRYDMVLNLADQWPGAVISKLTGAATRC